MTGAGVTTSSEGQPAWLADCSVCVLLLDALDLAAARGPGEILEPWEVMRAHLVDDHRERVTAYDPECPNCLEWQSTADAGPAPALASILERESLLHRAGHLIY